MYPGTIFNWYDQSDIPSLDAVSNERAPLFLAAASFDKGPENMRVVSGNQFYRLYGTNNSFSKHGQPAIQIANMINNGAKVLIKRVVADDATLANSIYVATVNLNLTLTEVDPGTDGAKTFEQILGYVPVGQDADKVYSVASNSTVKWTAVSAANAFKSADIDAAVESLLSVVQETVTDNGDGTLTVEGTFDYPIMSVCDNGRGVSNKAVKITPDYGTSRHVDNFLYNAYIYEGTTPSESLTAVIVPEYYTNGVNYTFNKNIAEQVVFNVYSDNIDGYLNKLAQITGYSYEELRTFDIVNLLNKQRSEFPNVTIDPDSIDLGAKYGVNLTNGTNGEFGDAPFGTSAYEEQLVNFFNGSFDDSIFDLDDYKIAAVFDANYPESVKDAISDLVTFREDCFFFRDLGVEVKTYASIVTALKEIKVRNRYIGIYITNYQIYDPINGRRIRVTSNYDLAGVMVSHFMNGAYRPVAGIANNMILTSAIEGTVNFTPRITPAVNQKTLLDDLRINYAIFYEGQCVMQTLYTSQENYTQLSYINNVLAIQEVARAVRTSCPKNRYTFANGNDFSAYATSVSNVLANYRNNFAELSFEYTQSAIHAAQKIFYASIKFRFNNWVQTEIFDLYALPTENTLS